MLDSFLQAAPFTETNFWLGFFIALALRRGRIQLILDQVIPLPDDEVE